MLNRLVLGGVSAALLALAVPARAEQLLTIYPLQPRDLSPEVTVQLDRLLRQQAEKLPAVIVHSRKKTRRAIARAAGAQRDCAGRLDCLVQVGELNGAGLLIFGTAAREQDAFVLDLKLIDVEKEQITGRTQARLSGDAAALTAQAQEALTALVLSGQAGGTLAVSMLVPGARVLVDDIEIGTTPLDPLTDLRPRAYSVTVLLEGAAPLQRTVQVQQATTATLRVDLADNRLKGTLSYDRELAPTGPPSPVAQALAQELLETQAVAASAAVAPATPSTSVPSPLPQPEAPARADAQSMLAPLMIAGVALAATGGVGSLLGAAGLTVWGYGSARASEAYDDDGNVVDLARYEEAERDRGMYVGLGTGGGVLLGVGLAALASGLGLVGWQLSAGADSGEGGVP